MPRSDPTGRTLGLDDPAGGGVVTDAERNGALGYAVANALVGAWLLLSPLLLRGTLVDREDDLVIGVLLVALAAYGGYALVRGRRLVLPAVLLSVFAGLWLLAFSLDYGTGRLLTYDGVVAGVVLATVDVYLYRVYLRIDERRRRSVG